MKAPPWKWELALPSVDNFALVAKRRLPFVAHTPLILPTAAWNYVAGINIEREIDSYYLRGKGSYYDKRVTIKNWHHTPAASSRAHDEFCLQARDFFPAHPDRDQLVMPLAGLISSFASAVDTCQLVVEFKAFPVGGQRNVLGYHQDDGDRLSAGFYLDGQTTVHLRPFWQSPLRYLCDAKAWRCPIGGYDHEKPFTQTPRQTFSMWPSQQSHSSPVGDGTSRIGIFVFVPSTAGPALR